MRAARDGANIAIAAKTEKPHPKLPARSIPLPTRSNAPAARLFRSSWMFAIYLVVAESRLIPPEAKAPQPDHDIHDRDPNSGLLHIIFLPGDGV